MFAGKPIPYGVNEFSLVTALKCGLPPITEISKKRKRVSDKEGKRNHNTVKSSGRMWAERFGEFKKPPHAWVLDMLLFGRKYKDALYNKVLSSSHSSVGGTVVSH